MKKEQAMAVILVAETGNVGFMWGSPGQGKSSLVRLGFPQLGYEVHVIRVNTILPHHLSGTPVPNSDGTAVSYLPPEWAIELNKAEKSVLFLDDVSCASPMGQTATLGLMDEREIGGLKLKAVPIAAANPNSLATARFDLDAAAANRCVHIQITSHAETYRENVLAGFPAPQVPKLRDNWRKLIGVKQDLITRFLCSPEGEAVVNCMPEQMSPNTVAWPSERSWHTLMEELAACDSLEPESIKGIDLLELRSIIFRGCVGDGAYQTFNNYFLKPMEVNVDEALRHGKAYSFPENGDQMFGLLGAVSNQLFQDGLDAKKWKQACSLLEGAWETSHRDRAVTFAVDLLSLNQERFALPKYFSKKICSVLDATV